MAAISKIAIVTAIDASKNSRDFLVMGQVRAYAGRVAAVVALGRARRAQAFSSETQDDMDGRPVVRCVDAHTHRCAPPRASSCASCFVLRPVRCLQAMRRREWEAENADCKPGIANGAKMNITWYDDCLRPLGPRLCDAVAVWRHCRRTTIMVSVATPPPVRRGCA